MSPRSQPRTRGHRAGRHRHSAPSWPRRSQPAAPRRDSGALFPGTPREAQRPRGLARPLHDLHALQSQRFKVRSTGRPSPAWPRRYSSPQRREPLARPSQRVNGRAPPPSEALCVSAGPAGPARDVPAWPAAPPRQRPSPMLISLAAASGRAACRREPLASPARPPPPGSPCCQEPPAPLAARCPPPHSSSTPCARRPLGCQECPGPVGKAGPRRGWREERLARLQRGPATTAMGPGMNLSLNFL